MVKFNLSSAALFSLLAFAVHSGAQESSYELEELFERDPGLFSVLKKIPVVGGLFGRDVHEFEDLSVRELTEEIEIAARDDPEVAALVARDPFFDILADRDYDEIYDLSMRELVEAVDLASRKNSDVADIVGRSPFLGSIIKKIPIIGNLFGRDDLDGSDLEARALGLGAMDGLD